MVGLANSRVSTGYAQKSPRSLSRDLVMRSPKYRQVPILFSFSLPCRWRETSAPQPSCLLVCLFSSFSETTELEVRWGSFKTKWREREREKCPHPSMIGVMANDDLVWRGICASLAGKWASLAGSRTTRRFVSRGAPQLPTSPHVPGMKTNKAKGKEKEKNKTKTKNQHSSEAVRPACSSEAACVCVEWWGAGLILSRRLDGVWGKVGITQFLFIFIFIFTVGFFQGFCFRYSIMWGSAKSGLFY